MNRKIKAGVAATVAAASIVTNVAFDPEDLTHDAAYLENQTRYVQMDEDGEEDVEYVEQERLSRADSLRAWFLRLPVAVKLVFLMPLWALGAVPAAVGTAALSALAPVWARALGFVLQAGVVVGAFCLAYKLVFPDRKVTELFKKKNRRWLLLGAVVVASVDLVLGFVWSGWPAARVGVTAAVTCGVLALLWHRICGKLKGPEPGVTHTKLRLEY